MADQYIITSDVEEADPLARGRVVEYVREVQTDTGGFNIVVGFRDGARLVVRSPDPMFVEVDLDGT